MRSRSSVALAVWGAVSLCLWLSPAGIRAANVFVGHDLLETDPFTTYQELSLPADFFGVGSDPFDERVFFAGAPFDCFDPDGPGAEPLYCGLRPTDTIVRRPAEAGPAFPDTIPVEIVQLRLVSAAPITVSFGGGASFQTWQVFADIEVDPGTGAVTPPQTAGTMTVRHGDGDGGTFDATLPVDPELTFVRLDAPGSIGPVPSPSSFSFQLTDEPWCHKVNPLGFPPGDIAVEQVGLTSNFFVGVFCAGQLPRIGGVTFSVDGGAFNPARSGAPNPAPMPPFPTLTPLPNEAEGLIQPDARHPSPNDVYAVGSLAQGYATEGELFQAAGASVGAPDRSNVDRVSAALGIGPTPGGPPFLGPFAPNVPGSTPAPAAPGVAGPPGSFGPPPGHTVGVLGLVPDDNIDALSFGRDGGDVLFFSVDPTTSGERGTDVRFHALASPAEPAAGMPFPTNPGGGEPGDEASGDLFKSVQLGQFGSYISLHFAVGDFAQPAALSANLTAVDEVGLGLQAPALNGSGILAPEDDLDGLEIADTGDAIFGVDVVDNATGRSPPDGIPERPVFHSIDTASPSNGLLLGAVSPDDILVTPPGGFSFSVFADGVTDIGLGVTGPFPPDDLDALVLSDVDNLGLMDPGSDEALFSLHPGSPLVLVGPDGVAGTGDEVSAADVFYTDFTGSFSLYAGHATLGLRPSDNVNALDIKPAVDHPAPVAPPVPPPCPCKKLTSERATQAVHGIRAAERKEHLLESSGTWELDTVAFGAVTADLGGQDLVETGATSFEPNAALSVVATEMVSMDLAGTSGVGPVTLRAGRSFGLPPSTGSIGSVGSGHEFPAASFFDVFVEIEVGGLLLHNEEPFRVQAQIDEFPPYGTSYQGNVPVGLFDAALTPQGQILSATHTPGCTKDADCAARGPCMAGSCDTPGGTCNYSPLADTDSDGVCDAADNCPQSANPGGQGPLVFGQTLEAVSTTQLCWADPKDVFWISGAIQEVNVYGTDFQQSLPAAVCLDPDVPPDIGLGRYYLVREDCPAGSWQNLLGVHRGRDIWLP